MFSTLECHFGKIRHFGKICVILEKIIRAIKVCKTIRLRFRPGILKACAMRVR